MAIYNQRANFSREQLSDHHLKRNSVTDILYSIIRVLCIIVQNLYCIPSYLVLSWLVLLPVSWFRNEFYSKLENHLYNSLLFIVSSWSLAAGLTIVESGDDFKHLIEEPEKYHSAQAKDDEPSADHREKLKQDDSDDFNKLNSKNHYSKRCLDNNSDSARNGYATNCNGTHRNDQISTFARSKFNYSTAVANGIIDKSTRTSMKNDPKASVTTRTNGENNRNGLDDKTIIDALLNGLRTTITAAKQENINHNNNNNNISIANDHTTTKKNGICNDASFVRLNNREIALASLALDTKTSEQVVSKMRQAHPRILFLCNHISTADVPLIMQSFSTLSNQSLLWVLDAQFKVTNFGVVCGSHGDYFVSKNTFSDGSLREHVLKFPDRNLLILFPEGGFLQNRIEGSNRYATKNKLPMTKYVTHPRYGAFKDLIDPSVGVTHIVNATLMYDDIKNPLSIIDIILGNKKQPAILDYKVYDRSEINPNEEWLRSIWLEKDKFLTEFYEDRENTLKRLESTLRAARLDWFKTLSVHLFYLLVCYLAIFKLFSATSVTMLKARELYYSNI